MHQRHVEYKGVCVVDGELNSMGSQCVGRDHLDKEKPWSLHDETRGVGLEKCLSKYVCCFRPLQRCCGRHVDIRSFHS